MENIRKEFKLIEVEKSKTNKKINVFHLNKNSDSTVFFVHGLGGRGEQFYQTIEYFKSNYDVNIVAYDWISHGGSSKSQIWEDFSFGELCVDFKFVFLKFKSEKKKKFFCCSFLGHWCCL